MLGEMMALLSCGTAIWAMTLAPIAMVCSSARIPASCFAAAIDIVVLREAIMPARIIRFWCRSQWAFLDAESAKVQADY